MQRIGQAWLVLEITGSGTLLGATAALQHLPTLLVGPWGGLFADRIDKRKLLVCTHILGGVLALVLALLVATGSVRFWMVLALALAHGSVVAFEHPARHSFVMEIVGKRHVTNAIMLNSVTFNAAKAVGPAVAGVVIATRGIAASFFMNAATYAVAAIALVLLRVGKPDPSAILPRERGQLREGLRYAWHTPSLRLTLGLMLVSGTLAYEWAVSLPLLARGAFDGDAATFGAMFSAMGLGAVIGGLFLAGRIQATETSLIVTAWLFGSVMLITSASPTLPLAITALFILGGASVAFRSIATTLVQLRSEPRMRGRVTALLSVALGGTTPIGAPLIGWLGENIGSRFAFALGGVGTLVVAALITLWRRRTIAGGRDPRQS